MEAEPAVVPGWVPWFRGDAVGPGGRVSNIRGRGGNVRRQQLDPDVLEVVVLEVQGQRDVVDPGNVLSRGDGAQAENGLGRRVRGRVTRVHRVGDPDRVSVDQFDR